MAGWVISIGLFIIYTQTHVMEVLIASGLFAIAGSIANHGQQPFQRALTSSLIFVLADFGFAKFTSPFMRRNTFFGTSFTFYIF